MNLFFPRTNVMFRSSSEKNLTELYELTKQLCFE